MEIIATKLSWEDAIAELASDYVTELHSAASDYETFHSALQPIVMAYLAGRFPTADALATAYREKLGAAIEIEGE